MISAWVARLTISVSRRPRPSILGLRTPRATVSQHYFDPPGLSGGAASGERAPVSHPTRAIIRQDPIGATASLDLFCWTGFDLLGLNHAHGPRAETNRNPSTLHPSLEFERRVGVTLRQGVAPPCMRGVSRRVSDGYSFNALEGRSRIGARLLCR